MSNFKLGDEIWFFYNESTTGNVYIDWLHLVHGKVVWVPPYEELLHIHVPGETQLLIVLDDKTKVYPNKLHAIEALAIKLGEFKNE